MNKWKYICISIICGIFLIFTTFEYSSNNTYNVLQVNTPFQICIDFNNNGIVDENELINILEGYQYISKESVPDSNIAKNLSLDEYTMYAFSYLTEKFSNDVLLDKKVFVKKSSDGNTIFIGNENYCDILLNSGYIFKNNKPCSQKAFEKRLSSITKANYKLYNAKSDKYHCLTCKYGLLSHNYVVLAKSQLPKGAKPCKYCLSEKYNKKSPEKKNFNKKEIQQVIIKKPSFVLSNGCIKIFLTDHTTKLKPDRLGNTALCDELVKQINSAKQTIDIAIYGYDKVPKIENAIKNAIARGVKIRLVYDIDSNNSNIYAHTKEFAKLIQNTSCDKAPINYQNPIYYTNSIMHDKFYIFDKSTVITGSANLSFTDMSGFNANSVVVIHSKEIANIYTKEFEQMYNSKFHNLKSKITMKDNITLGNTNLSVYFSPTDKGIQSVIIPLVNNAKKYIYMPVFLITDKNLSTALINAKNRGVDVRLIIDATNARGKYSKHRLLRENNIKVKTENYAGKLHSKSIIIDDQYTIIGSMNFSKSGELKNDENFIVLQNTNIAIFYKNFFNYLWSKIPEYWLTHDPAAEGVDSIGSCSDGIDNDYDRYTDSADSGCKMIQNKH